MVTHAISSPYSCLTVLTEEVTQQILSPFSLSFILWEKLSSHAHNFSENNLPVSGNSKAAHGGPRVPSSYCPQCARATPACFIMERVQIVFACVGLKSPVSVSAVLQPLCQRTSPVRGREKPAWLLLGPHQPALRAPRGSRGWNSGPLGLFQSLWLFITCSVVWN